MAFLPDNEEGRAICGLLKTAFDRRLTFTIGISLTRGPGFGECIIWYSVGGPVRLAALSPGPVTDAAVGTAGMASITRRACTAASLGFQTPAISRACVLSSPAWASGEARPHRGTRRRKQWRRSSSVREQKQLCRFRSGESSPPPSA
jgi:hypothetical protein